MPDPLKFVLNLTCESDAFKKHDASADDKSTAAAIPEVIRILRETAQRMEDGDDAGMYRTIHDVNGNDVGRFKLSRRI